MEETEDFVTALELPLVLTVPLAFDPRGLPEPTAFGFAGPSCVAAVAVARAAENFPEGLPLAIGILAGVGLTAILGMVTITVFSRTRREFARR